MLSVKVGDHTFDIPTHPEKGEVRTEDTEDNSYIWVLPLEKPITFGLITIEVLVYRTDKASLRSNAFTLMENKELSLEKAFDPFQFDLLLTLFANAYRKGEDPLGFAENLVSETFKEVFNFK